MRRSATFAIGFDMGMAYFAAAAGFLFGLYLALAPQQQWHRHYGRMIEGARPTEEGLTSIRRSGIALMVTMVLLAIFAFWFQVRSERRNRRLREHFTPERMERIMHPEGSPLDRLAEPPQR